MHSALQQRYDKKDGNEGTRSQHGTEGNVIL